MLIRENVKKSLKAVNLSPLFYKNVPFTFKCETSSKINATSTLKIKALMVLFLPNIGMGHKNWLTSTTSFHKSTR